MSAEERDAFLFDTLVALGAEAHTASGDACSAGLLGMAVRSIRAG